MDDQGFHARVLADSVSPAGIRLTTLEVRFPRFILSEFNTHRVFCLDGDTELYFDMPSYEKNGGTKRFTMALREFHDKWHHGAAPRKNRTRKLTVEKLCLSATYSARELAPTIPRVAIKGRPYRVRGLDVAHWLYDPVRNQNRQPLRERLAAMNLRSCDESTGEIYHTHVRDVCYSGRKEVFRVVLEDGRAILSTKDHQFLTRDGWLRLEDAVGLELSRNGVATWAKSAEFAMNGVDAYRDPEWLRARLRHFVKLDRIEFAGERDTYDVEVDGPYHNFVANGFIVHNSRNSASSRAVPTNRMVERVLQNPAMPVEWGVNKPGMSASETLTPQLAEEAKAEWLRARDSAVDHVRDLQQLNVHKQVINRIMEPFMWHTVIVTATEWHNFFKLRLAENAQPEIRVAAQHMRAAIDASKPAPIEDGAWHLPLIQEDERSLPIEQLKKISAARCARVSYLTHDGKRDIEKDIELCERLWSDRHLSPFEHVATPSGDRAFHANFRGWRQMRKELEEQGSV